MITDKSRTTACHQVCADLCRPLQRATVRGPAPDLLHAIYRHPTGTDRTRWRLAVLASDPGSAGVRRDTPRRGAVAALRCCTEGSFAGSTVVRALPEIGVAWDVGSRPQLRAGGSALRENLAALITEVGEVDDRDAVRLADSLLNDRGIVFVGNRGHVTVAETHNSLSHTGGSYRLELSADPGKPDGCYLANHASP